MSRSLSMDIRAWYTCMVYVHGICACSPKPSGPPLSHTAHSSVAVSPGWRRCRCGVSPFESSRATAPPAAAGKDKFCRTCGRGAENWLRWTDDEKVLTGYSRGTHGVLTGYSRGTHGRRELAPVDRRGEGAPYSPSPGADVGRGRPILGTDVPRPQMWHSGLLRSRAGVSGVAQSQRRGGHE
jgi:hypothetical protein